MGLKKYLVLGLGIFLALPNAFAKNDRRYIVDIPSFTINSRDATELSDADRASLKKIDEFFKAAREDHTVVAHFVETYPLKQPRSPFDEPIYREVYCFTDGDKMGAMIDELMMKVPLSNNEDILPSLVKGKMNLQITMGNYCDLR